MSASDGFTRVVIYSTPRAHSLWGQPQHHISRTWIHYIFDLTVVGCLGVTSSALLSDFSVGREGLGIYLYIASASVVYSLFFFRAAQEARFNYAEDIAHKVIISVYCLLMGCLANFIQSVEYAQFNAVFISGLGVLFSLLEVAFWTEIVWFHHHPDEGRFAAAFRKFIIVFPLTEFTIAFVLCLCGISWTVPAIFWTFSGFCINFFHILDLLLNVSQWKKDMIAVPVNVMYLTERINDYCLVATGEALLNILLPNFADKETTFWVEFCCGYIIVLVLAVMQAVAMPRDPNQIGTRRSSARGRLLMGMPNLFAIAIIATSVGVQGCITKPPDTTGTMSSLRWLLCESIAVAMVITYSVRLLHVGLGEGGEAQLFREVGKPKVVAVVFKFLAWLCVVIAPMYDLDRLPLFLILTGLTIASFIAHVLDIVMCQVSFEKIILGEVEARRQKVLEDRLKKDAEAAGAGAGATATVAVEASEGSTVHGT